MLNLQDSFYVDFLCRLQFNQDPVGRIPARNLL